MTDSPKRRTARIHLDPHMVRNLLALPDGMEMIAVDAANDPLGLTIIVRSDDLPEVEHDVESPRANVTVEGVRIDGGRPLMRVVSIEVPR